MNYEELVMKSQSLVVAIWDQDTTSRDDYMAGVTSSNKNISACNKIFQLRTVFPPGFGIPAKTEWRTVCLKHQDRDGHVREVTT